LSVAKGAPDQTSLTEKGAKASLNADSETPTNSRLGADVGVLKGVETVLLGTLVGVDELVASWDKDDGRVDVWALLSVRCFITDSALAQRGRGTESIYVR
jgi:hypothetical protein